MDHHPKFRDSECSVDPWNGSDSNVLYLLCCSLLRNAEADLHKDVNATLIRWKKVYGMEVYICAAYVSSDAEVVAERSEFIYDAS